VAGAVEVAATLAAEAAGVAATSVVVATAAAVSSRGTTGRQSRPLLAARMCSSS